MVAHHRSAIRPPPVLEIRPGFANRLRGGELTLGTQIRERWEMASWGISWAAFAHLGAAASACAACHERGCEAAESNGAEERI
jgi:hypothetical protein